MPPRVRYIAVCTAGSAFRFWASRTPRSLSVVLAASACGGGVQGRYASQGETLFESLTFGADGALEINLPGEERLMLTRVGSDLQGIVNGETVRFVQR